MKPRQTVTRRTFLVDLAAAGAAIAVAPRLGAASANSTAPAPDFRSGWDKSPDRVWAGAEFWTNPLQDWRVARGRVECINPATGRNLHVLTRDLAPREGNLRTSVRLGLAGDGAISAGKGSAGFLIGAQGPLQEYRNNLIFGRGLHAGLRTRGELFIGDGGDAATNPVNLGAVGAVELRLTAEPAGGAYRVQLEAVDPATGRSLGRVERTGVPGTELVGNLALAANFGPSTAPATPGAKAEPAPADRWWFADWQISGSKVAAHAERAFGPIWFVHYTLHDGILKLSAQLPPLGAKDDPRVRLQASRDGRWTTVAEAAIDPAARNALFRVARWDASRDVPYRVVYGLRDAAGAARESIFEGTIRRNPVDQPVLTVADLSCNAHFAFPNTACAANVLHTNPDLVAFTGDQYYESTGGYGVNRHGGDASMLDVLRKWAMHGWTWRELTRDRPAVSIPDDHDVYHGNLWGTGGGSAPGHDGKAESKGGYKMTADFVNMVHRMQTSHHPDSPAKPGKQGITGYYGPLTYGGVSFAILADRQYKSAPDGNVPPTTSGRADHVVDPNFDPKTADVPGLELLGEPQLEFIRRWAGDWRGSEMKAVISQTLFTAMATHHGREAMHLVADYDTNAWPQTARNAALRELRRAFAFHLAGDQHLPAVVHYGIDEHRDSIVAFASPAVNNLYFRSFQPKGTDQVLGNFRDSFGHPLTVLACANPQPQIRRGVLEAEMDKSAGYGLVRFDKQARTITVECWPLLADPRQPNTQFADWPVKVSQVDNYARNATAQLPELRVRGVAKPLVQVIDESNQETVYWLRLPGQSWRPPVFAAGSYTIRVSDPDTGRARELKNQRATAGNTATVEVAL